MGKKDFKLNVSQQWDNKNDSVLETKLNKTEDENLELRKKIKDFENNGLTELSILNIKDLKLLSNIRDNLEYEEIEILAENIKKQGQLQPVLVSKDDYLLAGYRRYNAIKFLHENSESNGNIIYYRFNKTHEEISDFELKEIQFSENEYRRNIDYFQLSKLYNSYKDNSGSQKELTDIFRKSKGTISAILKINNIDSLLVNYLKQFQIYAWSEEKYKKFAAANFDNNDEKLLRFYNDNKVIIGWRPLYEIAKNDNLEDQKKAFLSFFSNRLTEEELQKDFSFDKKEKNKTEDSILVIKKTTNQIKNIIKNFEALPQKAIKKSTHKEISLKLNELKNLLELELSDK